jgi:hypothetical protein
LLGILGRVYAMDVMEIEEVVTVTAVHIAVVVVGRTHMCMNGRELGPAQR